MLILWFIHSYTPPPPSLDTSFEWPGRTFQCSMLFQPQDLRHMAWGPQTPSGCLGAGP